MAVNYSTAVKNTRMQAVIDAIGSGGLLKIGTTGMSTVLATITLATPAVGALSATDAPDVAAIEALAGDPPPKPDRARWAMLDNDLLLAA